MKKTKPKAIHLRAIVINEHTLALVMNDGVQILRASILRGSSYSGNPHPATDYLPPRDQWRYANKEDFDTYNVFYRKEWIATPEEIADLADHEDA